MKPIIKIVIIIVAVFIILMVVVAQRFLSSRTENKGFLEATKMIEKGAQLSNYRRDGYDIYKKSKIKGYVPEGWKVYYKGQWLEPGFHEVEDYCYQDHPENFSFRGNGLKEYFVESWNVGSMKFHNILSFLDRECKCVDGACVKPAPVSKCTETDNGMDIYTKGKIIGINKNEDFISEFEDSCDEDGTMLLEGFCMEGMTYHYKWIPCETGCEEGHCRNNIESPDKVVSNFYACYLGCVQGSEYKVEKESPGNFCIKKCDGLSEVFKQHLLQPVEGALADRIIWASDVPGIDAVTIEDTETNQQESSVFVNFLPVWPAHRLKVSLELVNGQWKISNVKDIGK